MLDVFLATICNKHGGGNYGDNIICTNLFAVTEGRRMYYPRVRGIWTHGPSRTKLMTYLLMPLTLALLPCFVEPWGLNYEGKRPCLAKVRA